MDSRLFDVLPDDTWFDPGHGEDSPFGEQKPHIDVAFPRLVNHEKRTPDLPE
ncbi:hypothetical protein [Kibdelosporangium persicum]|uniref:hypothetical protein n=1 Tax=Kibdelosporangium persicum TaxID=2698649 RepID=UPI0015640A7C